MFDLKILCSYEVELIMKSVEEFGGEVRLVGGCVRDCILKRQINDIDLATNLLPDQIVSALSYNGIRTILTNIKYGTVIAVFENQSFEITTLRQDVECYGRKAEVKFTDKWQIDASRRDFTINALYVDKDGNLYDYFEGIKDLELSKLRFIGEPEKRIKEDYLRILRLFRLQAQLSFDNLEETALFACKKYSLMLSSNVSGERIRDEMFKLLECQNSVRALKKMKEANVLKYIISEKTDYSILSSKLLFNTDKLVKLALLIRTTNEPNLGDELSEFWHLSNKQKKRLLFLIENFIDLSLSVREQKKYIVLFGKELYYDLIIICGIMKDFDKKKVNQCIQLANEFVIPKFPLSGKDLLNITYQPGEKLGKDLTSLREYWKDSDYSLTKTELTEIAKKLFKTY